MIEELAQRVGGFLLQWSDPIDLLLEIAVVVASEVTAPIVLQSLPVEDGLLLNRANYRGSDLLLTLLKTQFLVDLLYLLS